jgi:hypothetical protein
MWIALVLLTVAACKDKKADTTPKNTTDAASKIDPTLCEESGKRVATFDLNKDGKPDVWKLYANNVLTCKQDDFDHDGRKDWLAAYDASGQTLYQKADFDYDGKFDMVQVFENGQKSEAERDTDFDGKFDVKEIYAGGQLDSVRRDRNGDNKPDQWEQYSSGVLIAITYDDDFDGKVDRRSDTPSGESAPQEQTPAPAPGAGGGSSASGGSATQPLTAPATPAPKS